MLTRSTRALIRPSLVSFSNTFKLSSGTAANEQPKKSGEEATKDNKVTEKLLKYKNIF